MKAPQIDNFLASRENHPQIMDENSVQKFSSIWSKMQLLKVQGGDELRSIWICGERGKIEDFGDFQEYLDEEEVENEQDFREMWLDYYPAKQKWYKFTVSKYQNVLYLYFDSKLCFQIGETSENIASYTINTDFLTWLEEKVEQTISDLQKNTTDYNAYISKNLPYQKRVGKILRQDFWTVFPEWKKDFEIFQNDTEALNIIETLSKNSSVKEDEQQFVNSMTSGDFFRYCEIGYDANQYFKNSKEVLSPKEKYLGMADGRDCGLRNLDENSTDAFSNWYKNDAHCGGHPWEICRGGNSTHISFFVRQTELAWTLRLAGSSRSRVVETLKMAIALYKAKIPFILQDAEALFAMVAGKDYIGIVPEGIIPRYCHSYFPQEDKIMDFMNLGIEKRKDIVNKTHWYQIEKVNIAD